MIEFTLYGVVPSKKNSYSPRAGGMYKNSELQAGLNDLEMQVPGDVRDLRLEHPDIVFKFHCRTARQDRDNMVTTILDVMVRCGVLVDDNLKHCNGTMTILPADIGEEDSACVMLIPKETSCQTVRKDP